MLISITFVDYDDDDNIDDDDSTIVMIIQVNLDMTDPVGPGKLVCHMQNPSYAYDRLSPSYASVYAIALVTSFDRYKSQNSEIICLVGLLLYMYLSATPTTRRCELSVWLNVTQHMS